MKKSYLYLWLAAYFAAVTACSHATNDTVCANVNKHVTIGTTIQRNLSTRSATDLTVTGHTLRYVLEVWQTEGTSPIFREEKLQQPDKDMSFSFDLENSGEYTILVWADYVKESAESSEETVPCTHSHYTDLYYQNNTSNGLKEITIIPESYAINEAGKEAFCACKTIVKGIEAFNTSITLTRPFGQFNLSEKNTSLLEKVKTIACTYQIPDTYNVATGKVGSNTITVKPSVSALPSAGATHKANLLYDFIFAPEGNAAYLSDITIKFTSNDQAFPLKDFALATNNIPLLRNKRTNVQGSILQQDIVASGETDITIQIDSQWLPDEEQTLPEAENGNLSDFINQENPFE